MKAKLKCIEVGTCTNGLHFLFGMKQLIGKEFTVEKISQLRVSPEGQEGMNAFLEKRKPQWKR